MKNFEIILKNEKLKQYERITLFIIIINLALFIYLGILSDIKLTRIIAIIAAVLILGTLSLDFFLTSKKNNAANPYKLTAEFIILFNWLMIGYWMVAICCLLLVTLYYLAKRPLRVTIVKEKITYPSFLNKNIPWSELNNIMLKDGLLTIDFKNNNFIQQAVDETMTAVNEKEFNDFCNHQLKLAAAAI